MLHRLSPTNLEGDLRNMLCRSSGFVSDLHLPTLDVPYFSLIIWVHSLTSLRLSFLICEMRTHITPNARDYYKDQMQYAHAYSAWTLALVRAGQLWRAPGHPEGMNSGGGNLLSSSVVQHVLSHKVPQ